MDHDQSPETELSGDRKRKRKVLSCSPCRRRKVQCDRGLPACSRCSKAGKAASCVYEDDAPPASNGSENNFNTQGNNYSGRQNHSQNSVTVSKDVWDDMLSRLLQQERTIERAQAGRTNGITNGTPRSHVSSPNFNEFTAQDNLASKQIVLFRGKSFTTHFYGPLNLRSSLAHVRDYKLIVIFMSSTDFRKDTGSLCVT